MILAKHCPVEVLTWMITLKIFLKFEYMHVSHAPFSLMRAFLRQNGQKKAEYALWERVVWYVK